MGFVDYTDNFSFKVGQCSQCFLVMIKKLLWGYVPEGYGSWAPKPYPIGGSFP